MTEAREWRQRAAVAVDDRREALEAWDAAAADAGRPESAAHEPWRLRQLAADPGGYLHRARTAAWRATDLARTSQEKYRAAALLAAIEHELGHPDEELQQARTLVALQPRSDLSLLILRRAALCSACPVLAARIDPAVAAVRQHADRASRESPSAAALLESRRHWIEAWNAVGADQSQLQAWDPAAVPFLRSGEPAAVSVRPELELADQSARRAAALARSKAETCRSVRWLARVECALGRHREELRLAKRLVSMAPRDEGSLTCLVQAANCNGLTDLGKQTLAALETRHPSPPASVRPARRAKRGAASFLADPVYDGYTVGDYTPRGDRARGGHAAGFGRAPGGGHH